MGKALYRKYRPQSLVDIGGQSHITTTLANAIKSGKISHAYLLTGPRGVGKTSIARILAHELNGIPYDDSRANLDIIEIDAASNRRIDEIRNLREKVHVLPTSNKYKIYIIDEVHMLTREAFNALLKTLEEPPAHVIFILATTEAHKLPETIVSRTQHFAFRPIEPEEVVKHLTRIAKAEKFAIDQPALELIAKHGGGSFRDSISLLDQARGLGEKITKEDIERLLGVAPDTAITELASVLQSGTPKALFENLASLRSNGQQSARLAQQLGDFMRARLLEDAELQSPLTIKLLQDLLHVAASAHADRLLEISLLDYQLARQPTSVTAPSHPAPAASVHKPTIQAAAPASAVPKVAPDPQATKKAAELTNEGATIAEKPKPHSSAKPAEDTPKKAASEKEHESSPAKKSAGETNTPAHNPNREPFTVEAWPVVLATIRKKYNTLYGILRMATPAVEGNTLTLSCTFSFHQKQINESKNRKLISDIILDQTGQAVEITCVVVPKNGAAAGSTEAAKVNAQSVSDIFGGAEVLES